MTHRPFGGLAAGDRLGPLELSVSAVGNARYWAGAGVTAPPNDPDLLYPPMAANLTILLLQTAAPGTMIHTHQHLRWDGTLHAGTPLVVTGRVTECFERRGRPSLTCTAEVAPVGAPTVWWSTATFFEQDPGRS